jgi:alginate O-acetyltransferase complex protein AlgI
MLFSSFTYIFCFLPLTVLGFFLVRRRSLKLAKAWLLCCSVGSYATAGPQYIPVLLASILLNYLISAKLRNTPDTRGVLMAGIAGNVVILCIFKYVYFALSNFNLVFGTHLQLPVFALPAGVSFYTIQQIMYLVDRAEGLVEHQDILDHAVFVSFFPYVLMGPIVRAGQVLPQLNEPCNARWNTENVCRGIFIFLIGLFKKAVLADTFGRWANIGFSYPGTLAFADGWLTALAYSFQLYFDFSGYTDMAIGSGLMLNVSLPQNFNGPFRALGVIEYWGRWHITLTNFITTYLYTPIVKSFRKLTFSKAMFATVMAMGIAGLWHGAAWTFVVWGFLHGFALVVNHLGRRRKIRLPRMASHIVTCLFLLFAFVVFRAPTLARAGSVFHAMLFPGKLFDYDLFRVIDPFDQVVGFAWMIAGVIIAFAGPTSATLQDTFKPTPRMLALAAFAAAVGLLYLNSLVSQGFLYRDF